MINKFDFIRSMAVFQDYIWDNVFEKNKTFKKINIIYGRNYSGKTTLSRIVRALETGRISTNYDNPRFQITWDNGNTSTPDNLTEYNENIRVFNEDFVRENLGFLTDTSNPNGTIEPFAVLGAENLKIQEDIKTIQDELGCSEDGKESGLYLKIKLSKKEQEEASRKHEEKVNSLKLEKKIFATDKSNGIKYQFNSYGDQNYDVKKLNKDIHTVLSSDYQPINNNDREIHNLNNCINETIKKFITLDDFTLPNFYSLCKQVKELVERKIGSSEKIQELIRNQMLNEWVKEGCTLHSERTTCAFCGQAITSERREVLHRHFDEETQNLENEIKQIIQNIYQFQATIQKGFIEQQECFYTKYQSDLDGLRTKYSSESNAYLQSMALLLKQLEQRKQAITVDFSFKFPKDFTAKINDILSYYKELCKQSNKYTANIEEEKRKARECLRLNAVQRFCDKILYKDLTDKIEQLEKEKREAERNVTELQTQINEKLVEIDNLRRQLNDESKGAEEVNYYLNHILGHPFLSLVAISEENIGSKQVRFEIQRSSNKAYNLSEGECRLIAFCYFMAKLNDINTKDKKPILWIDDPISSLDGNHIFFVYSLLRSEILDANAYKQIFVSTHNLEFLKYLNSTFRHNMEKITNYYLIERNGTESSLKEMPKYLKLYTTEFIYLFKQIYNCATEQETDSNFETFYNFGNNARKFLEIYRIYRFPNSATSYPVNLIKLFGDKIKMFFVDRLNNESSHLVGSFERGARPIDSPAIREVAQCILDGIKNADTEQYYALLECIDANKSEE